MVGVLSDLNSMDEAINTVENFSRVAGPKLNVEKTEGIPLGPFKDSIPSSRGIELTNGAIYGSLPNVLSPCYRDMIEQVIRLFKRLCQDVISLEFMQIYPHLHIYFY